MSTVYTHLFQRSFSLQQLTHTMRSQLPISARVSKTRFQVRPGFRSIELRYLWGTSSTHLMRLSHVDHFGRHAMTCPIGLLWFVWSAPVRQFQPLWRCLSDRRLSHVALPCVSSTLWVLSSLQEIQCNYSSAWLTFQIRHQQINN